MNDAPCARDYDEPIEIPVETSAGLVVLPGVPGTYVQIKSCMAIVGGGVRWTPSVGQVWG